MRYQLFQFSLSIYEVLQLFFYDCILYIVLNIYVAYSKALFSFLMEIFVNFFIVKAETTWCTMHTPVAHDDYTVTPLCFPSKYISYL